MRPLQRYRSLFNDYLIADHYNDLSITVFCKSLYIFLLLKIYFMWSVLPDLLNSDRFIGYNDVTVYGFLAILIIALSSGIILKVNFISAFIIFILSFILTRSTFLVINGSDLILNLFLFLSVFLGKAPRFKNQTLNEVQLVVSNFSFLFCKVQLTLLYLQSGFDKLSSDVWRSGDAIFYITHLDYFFSPLISISESSFLILAWATILFELSFALLIWVKKFRIALLSLGVIFHLGIAIFLSLPDFGMMMILTYSLFIPFERFDRVAKKVAFGGS